MVRTLARRSELHRSGGARLSLYRRAPRLSRESPDHSLFFGPLDRGSELRNVGSLPADIAEEVGNYLLQAILDARVDLVSQVPGARHITDTQSGHYLHQEQPQLVIGSVREVVEAARKKACAFGTKDHGQCIKTLKHPRR
jgi:hypothetical protein